MRRQGGFALILVIWALILLTTIAAGFSHAVRVETATATHVTDEVRAEAAAIAAIHRAIVGTGATEPDLRWKVDGRRYEIPWPNAKLAVTLRSEAGKVDINHAPRPVLVGLINAVGAGNAGALADTLMDWRDRDSQVRDAGAEANEYLNAGRAYTPANGPFSSLSELAQVQGFNGELVERLRPYMTIYSRRPKIDALNADALVLAAVPGIDRDTAGDFVAARALAAREERRVDLAPLQAGMRYLETRGGGSLVSAQVEVELDNGYRYAETAVYAVSRSARGFEILARNPTLNLDGTNDARR